MYSAPRKYGKFLIDVCGVVVEDMQRCHQKRYIARSDKTSADPIDGFDWYAELAIRAWQKVRYTVVSFLGHADYAEQR